MTAGAAEVYDALRAQVLHGGGCRSGLAAILYHGMLQGLALVAAEPLSAEPPAGVAGAAPPDDAMVRLLANMILNVQPEVVHVY